MFGIGPMELIVIVVVALLIFGPQRLPEFARTLGKGLAEFRRASNELRQTLALDELESDLRKTANQIKSPPPASRPAQAGDTLPAGVGGATAAAAAVQEAGDGVAPDPAAAAAPATTPTWKDHPGELPEGGDHDHHDRTDPNDRDTRDDRIDPAALGVRDRSASEPPRPAAADPGLGNVPVGGGDPTETRRG